MVDAIKPLRALSLADAIEAAEEAAEADLAATLNLPSLFEPFAPLEPDPQTKRLYELSVGCLIQRLEGDMTVSVVSVEVAADVFKALAPSFAYRRPR